jgi:TolB-like protein/class 3 adenylate cyclase/Flp pilus assembly protein TadD
MAATRRLAAILAADVAGYSRLIGADEPGTLQRLRATRAEVIDPAVERHNGRIVKTTGDGLLIEFGSTVDALRCATEVQTAMAERNAGTAAENRIAFRIGIHQGDIVAEDGDIFGDGVNIAARLEALAAPGGICVSARVQEDAAGKLDLAFRDLGEQRLRNIARPVRAYAIGIAARPHHSRWIKGAMIGAAGAIAIVVIAAAWWTWPRENPTLPTAAAPPAAGPSAAGVESKAAPPPLSLVVLPFANLSNDPEQEYFADGVTDDLTTDLSRFPGSFVIARNTAFTYRGKPTDAKQIGHDLAVRYVVEGSVRRTGDQVQVNVQLIDAESGVHLWADRFDTDRRELAKAQAEITVRLARMLNKKLVAAEITRSEQRTAVDPDARDFVMRAWGWMYRPTSPTTLKEARLPFERALEIDPRSNDARIGLANTLAVAVGLGTAGGSASQDIPRAEQLAAEAIERDPNSSKAHEALGRLRLTQKGRLREAQAEFETALSLDRNNTNAVRQLGWASLHLGEPETCIAQGEKGLRLSPRDPSEWAFLAQLGVCHLFLNHDDLATDYLMKARAVAPQVWWIHFNLAGALGLKGDLEGGRAAFTESLKLKPEINSIAQYLARKPWYSSPEELPIEDHTLLEGLRRLGFPES